MSHHYVNGRPWNRVLTVPPFVMKGLIPTQSFTDNRPEPG
jgi:hypothetical protein